MFSQVDNHHSKPFVLIVVEDGCAESYHDEDVRVAVIDMDGLKSGEAERVKEELPDTWNTDWQNEFPVAVAYINEQIADAYQLYEQ